MSYDVAIIGCGPVGATLANNLRSLGHSVAIFERYKDVFYCPRAGGLDDETLRQLDQIGILDDLIADRHIYEADLIMCDANERPIGVFNRRRLGDEHVAGHAGYPNFNMIYQPGLERALRGAYVDSELVDTYMGHQVTHIEERPDGVLIKHTETETGQVSEVEAKYVVGCDGANSFVRKMLDVGDTDFNYSEKYLIVDAIVEDDDYLKARFPDGAKMIFDPVYAGIVGKSMHGRVRLDFRIHSDSVIGRSFESDEDYDIAAKELIAARNFDLEKLEIIRRVEYEFAARTPEKWRVGRLLVAGDAAHLTPPWSGQGLNMGMRDAANITFKLNMVLTGKADAHLLDTYTAERRPASLKTIKGAVDTGKLMEATNPVIVALRTLAIRLSGVSQTVARVMSKSWQNKPPYKDGFIGDSHKSAGSWMIQPRISDPEGNVMLMDKMIGPKFAIISTDSAIGENVYRFITELGGVVLKQGMDFKDVDGRFMRWCKKNRAHTVLLRPDRYVFDAGNDANALCASLFEKLEGYSEN